MSSAYTIGHYVRTTLPRIGLEFILPSNPNISVFHSLFKSCSETKDSRWAFITFRRLLESNVKPSDLTFSLLIKAYVADASSSTVIDSPNAKIEANQIQTHLRKSGFNQYVYLTTAFLDFYGKLGCIYYAQHLFEEMPRRDVVSWNALICGYSRNGYDYDALEVFVQMLRECFSPCQRTLVGLVPSCGRPDIIFQGKAIHGFGIKSGLDLDCRVKNALTSMYAKCADLQAAEVLFEEIFEKTEVSWNTMIGAYGQNGLFDEAMLVFKQMQKERVEVNYVTIISLLSANAHLDSTHCYVIKTGFATDASVITSLVCSYAGCGNIESAGLLYNLMPQRNLVSLTAMISGYAEKGNMGLVVECFTQMLQLKMKPDAVAMVSILHGFTDPTFIGSGLGIHAYGLKTGLCADCLVVNGLISMYSKFGDIETVFSLFSEMGEKQLISWNSVISACIQVGRTSDAMELFCQMRMYGHSPDAITIASLLAGCSEVGFLQFGERLHNYVLRNNLDMEDFLETALVDMYIKCGRLESAERVFKSIKEPCLATWNTMISGYGLSGHEHRALSCYSEMQEQGLKPDRITFLGVLSACTHGGLVWEGKRYFRSMREDFGMIPGLQHNACMVDLLSRAGFLEEAVIFVKNMEVEPDSAVWGALLTSCCIHQELKLGECLAKRLLLLDYNSGGLYVLMSNLYASKGRWDDVARVRKMMKDTGGDGSSGISLIEVSSLEKMNNSLCLSDLSLNTNYWQLSSPH